MSDEDNFHLSDYVSPTKGRYTRSKLLRGVLFTLEESFFFDNATDQTTTVDGARYRAMITDLFLPHLDEFLMANKWFQQGGVTADSARQSIF